MIRAASLAANAFAAALPYVVILLFVCGVCFVGFEVAQATFRSPPWRPLLAEAMAAALTVFLSYEPRENKTKAEANRLTLINAVQIALISFTFALVGWMGARTEADFNDEFKDFSSKALLAAGSYAEHEIIVATYILVLAILIGLAFYRLHYPSEGNAYGDGLRAGFLYLAACALFVVFLFLKLAWTDTKVPIPQAIFNATGLIVLAAGGLFGISRLVKLLVGRVRISTDWVLLFGLAITAFAVWRLANQPPNFSAHYWQRALYYGLAGAAAGWIALLVIYSFVLVRWSAKERYWRPIGKRIVGANIDEALGEPPPLDWRGRPIDEIWPKEGPPYAPDEIKWPEGFARIIFGPVVLILYACEWPVFWVCWLAFQIGDGWLRFWRWVWGWARFLLEPLLRWLAEYAPVRHAWIVAMMLLFLALAGLLAFALFKLPPSGLLHLTSHFL